MRTIKTDRFDAVQTMIADRISPRYTIGAVFPDSSWADQAERDGMVEIPAYASLSGKTELVTVDAADFDFA